MNLFSFHSPLIGLDIQADSIRMVECKKISQNVQLINAAVRTLPEGIFHEGKIVAWDLLQSVLIQFVAHYKISGKVAICLPQHLVHMQQIQLPANLSDAAIESEINSQMQRDLPGIADPLCIDFNIAPCVNTGHIDVFFVATRQAYLHQYVACINAAGLKVCIVDVDIYALKRALCFALPLQQINAEAILYLTKLTAILLIFDNNNVLYHQQWDRKINYPNQLIQLCFNYLRNIEIDKLTICGPDQSITLFSQEMDQSILQKYSLQFYALDPFAKMHCLKHVPDISAETGHFIMASGLAMREVTKWC